MGGKVYLVDDAGQVVLKKTTNHNHTSRLHLRLLKAQKQDLSNEGEGLKPVGLFKNACNGSF
jgi:hypothetical protein